MIIFDYINDILHTKKKNLLTTEEEETEFQPFILNRWLSMYSPAAAKTSNILNKYLSIFNTKKELYILFHALFDKQPSRRINYFKRKKTETTTSDDHIDLIAKNMEISQRETKDYIFLLDQMSK
jgi:hypothetical protein